MAPGTPSWLNVEFAEGILRRYEGDNSIQVIDMFSKPATSKGDNYTSDMIRVIIEFSRNQGDRQVNEKKSLIIKIQPTEGFRQVILQKSDLFETEISMMTTTLKKMNELLGPGVRLNAQVLHVQRENPVLLVLEDLATFGFRMADRHVGLDLMHCLHAIRGLARFHASSVALCEKEPKHKDLYQKGIFSPEHPVEMRSFFEEQTSSLADEVESWPEIGERYAEKIRKTATQLYESGSIVVKRHKDEFSVLNHGDFWVNNMLFRYDDDGNPIEHIFVDFQLCIYTSPAIDILYFMSTSPSDEVIANNEQEILDEYLRTLTDTMKLIGCETQPPTMEELKRQLKERALYGMIASFAVLPFVRVDKGKAMDLDEIMEQGKKGHPGLKSQAYRRIMTKRIPMYDEMGLFNF